MATRLDQPHVATASASADDAGKKKLVIIKKYANRRLYNTETSSYVTLDDIAQMVRSDREFQVFDAKTGDDLTHSVLTQIIVEQESRSGGPALLPIPFLRQLIRFYDDSLARMVPGYLQMSLDILMREQDRFRSQFGTTWAGQAFESYQEQARRNLALFEQAMKLWTPFSSIPTLSQDATGAAGAVGSAAATRTSDHAGSSPAATEAIKLPASEASGTAGKSDTESWALDDVAAAASEGASHSSRQDDDLADMRAQLAAMQAQLDKLARDRH